MHIKRLDDHYSVSAQLQPSDLETIAGLGFRSVICHRPDDETDDQPGFETIATAAREAGLQCRYQPVSGTGVVDAQIDEFSRIRAELPTPVLAYCRSGMRSASIWTLSQAGQGHADAALKAMGGAGYDVSALTPRVRSVTHGDDRPR